MDQFHAQMLTGLFGGSLGDAAVHHDLVAAVGETAANLFDGGLKSAIAGRNATGTHERYG
ncbi:hypothetical protein GCM10009596_05190 [Arthrobacter rhombi]